MEKRDFLELLKKYRLGKASKQEIDFLGAYYDLFEDSPDITETLTSEEKGFLKNQIKADIYKKLELHNPKLQVKSVSLFRRLTVAASILLVVSITLFLGKQNYPIKNSAKSQNQVSDIAPGGNKAILELANGANIVLDSAKNGRLAQQGNVIVNKATNGKIIYSASDTVSDNIITYNTITTPRGGQYIVVLPDSSIVYLNAASSLRFPTTFSSQFRSVTLTGEGYFEITHNKNRPFQVITKNQKVEVLGTHFNINAYDDEKIIKTTLIEGKVKVEITGVKQILSPGEQSQINNVFSGNQKIDIVKHINTDEVIAWKNGFFQFENANIKTIMRQFTRWYNVDVEFPDSMKERLFSGKIHRNLSLLQALDLLEYANIHFKMDGKKIIVLP